MLAIVLALSGGSDGAAVEPGVTSEGAGLPALLDLRGAAMTSFYLDNDAAVAALVDLYTARRAEQVRDRAEGQGLDVVDSGAATATRSAQLEASAAVRARLEVGSNGLTPGQVRRLKRACGDAFVLTVDDAEIAESEALLFEWNDCVLS